MQDTQFCRICHTSPVVQHVHESHYFLADSWLNLPLLQVRKDHWKGMSAEQLAAIKQQQAAQQELKRAAEAAAAAAEADAVAHSRSVQRAVLLQAQSAEQARRQQPAAVAAALKEQMAAKAAKDAQTNKLYANKVCAGRVVPADNSSCSTASFDGVGHVNVVCSAMTAAV